MYTHIVKQSLKRFYLAIKCLYVVGVYSPEQLVVLGQAL